MGVQAGTLTIDLVADIARLQTGLDQAKRLVKAASNDIALNAAAANAQATKATTAGTSAAAQYAAQTERLEARVRVLERIATDRGADVAAQIEQLRDDRLN